MFFNYWNNIEKHFNLVLANKMYVNDIYYIHVYYVLGKSTLKGSKQIEYVVNSFELS